MANVAFSQYRKKISKIALESPYFFTIELIVWPYFSTLEFHKQAEHLHIQKHTHIHAHPPTYSPNRQPFRKKQTEIPFAFLYVPSILLNLWQKLIDIPIVTPIRTNDFIVCLFLFPIPHSQTKQYTKLHSHLFKLNV